MSEKRKVIFAFEGATQEHDVTEAFDLESGLYVIDYSFVARDDDSAGLNITVENIKYKTDSDTVSSFEWPSVKDRTYSARKTVHVIGGRYVLSLAAKNLTNFSVRVLKP